MSFLISFETEKVVYLPEGIVYYNGNKVLALDSASYDISYLISLIDQCKQISKTIPMNFQPRGIQYESDQNRYILV